MGFVKKIGSERGQTQDWNPYEKIMMAPVCLNDINCIVLTKIKAMSLSLFWLFEELLSMQFFWNTQRKKNYPRAIFFEIFYQIFVMITQKIIRCNLNAGVFKTSSSKMECFFCKYLTA